MTYKPTQVHQLENWRVSRRCCITCSQCNGIIIWLSFIICTLWLDIIDICIILSGKGVHKYIHEIISVQFTQQTRLAKTGAIRDVRELKKGIGQSSYIHRAINYWNEMPSDLRQERNLKCFIPKLKDWVKKNY